MGLEVAFTRNIIARPLAGPGALSFEATDLDLTSPNGSRQFPARDMPEINPLPEASSELAITPAEPLISTRPSARNYKWTAAIVASGLLHAALAAAFLIATDGTFRSKDSGQIEGADQSGDMVAGNGSEMQAAAGNPLPPDVTPVTLVTMSDPKPAKRVEAEPVQTTQTVEPTDDAKTDTPVTEALQPVPDATQQPVAVPEATEPVANETAAADPSPEILTAQTLSDKDGAAKKSPPPSRKVEVMEVAKAEPAKEAPTTPTMQKQLEQTGKSASSPTQDTAAEPEKPIAKPNRPKSKPGSGGESKTNVPNGLADGANDNRVVASTGGQKSVGNASASNYPGKIAEKLRRVQRGISNATRAKALNNARISFVIDAAGNIADIRLVKSSGSSELDQAALGIIQKASPFPPIPPDAGRTNWAFTIPIGPF